MVRCGDPGTSGESENPVLQLTPFLLFSSPIHDGITFPSGPNPADAEEGHG